MEENQPETLFTKTRIIIGSGVLVVFLLIIGVVAASGGSSDSEYTSSDDAKENSGVKVKGKVEVNSSTTTSSTSSTTTLATVSTTPTTRYVAPVTAAPSPIMPNVICMNLQDAQDRIQETGVFYSKSVDASGNGRSQVIDSNWIVVGQYPTAGSAFGEGEAVLSALKYGESNLC